MIARTEAPFRLRPCEAGDETAIIDLFRRSFNAPYDLALWRRKYQSSPWARPDLSMVAEAESGEVIGHVGAMLHPVNLVGRPQRVAQCTDFMIAPRHRSRGTFRILFEAYLERITEAGIDICLGFPNENSLRAMHLAACHVAIMKKYHLPLGGAHHTRLRERVAAAPERSRFPFEFDGQYELDERYDAIWHSCSKHESLSVWKDREYMTWKYCAAPDPIRLFALGFAGEVVAVAVCSERGKRADVRELLSRDKNIHAARELMLHLADDYLGRSFEEIRFVGWDPWFFEEVFADFERRPTFWGHFFVRAANRSEAFLYENPLNWTVASGDSDS